MVTGAVAQPGRQSLRNGIASALDALNNAGGIAGPPWHFDVILRRGTSVDRHTVADLQNGGDFPLKPGDRLMVEQNTKRFVALGALQTAGAFEFPSPDLNLLEALAAARGLSDRQADRTGVYVFRPAPSPDGQHALFLLDMSESDSLFIANAFAMKPGDAVYVSNAPLTDFMKIVDPILRAIAIFNFSTTAGQ
jgi:polysaccharide export outer membrane protein